MDIYSLCRRMSVQIKTVTVADETFEEGPLPDFRSCLMIDLGRETDGNNEICLGVRFALCIIRSSTTRSYWALFLGRWSTSFILCKEGPLDLSFSSFLSFLHCGIENVEEHLVWKLHKKNSKEKLVKCATEIARLDIGFQSCTQIRPSLTVQSRSPRLNLTF